MRELTIIYEGCGLAGRSESIRHVDRALGGTALKTHLSDSGGTWVRAQVNTAEGSVILQAVYGGVFDPDNRARLLAESDAVVFVVDSQRERFEANVEAIEHVQAFFAEHGSRGVVIQWNKRDFSNRLDLETLSRLNVWHAPEFETVASKGRGVLEAFNAAVALARLRAERM